MPPLVFSIREAPQSSLGFAPFKMVFRHHLRRLLDLVQESWEEGTSEGTDTTEYVRDLRHGLQAVSEVSCEHLQQAREDQTRRYDKGAQRRALQVGQKVLVLLPSTMNTFLTCWQGPFEIVRNVGPVDYEVSHSGHKKEKQIYRIHLLKIWQEQEGLLILRKTIWDGTWLLPKAGK